MTEAPIPLHPKLSRYDPTGIKTLLVLFVGVVMLLTLFAHLRDVPSDQKTKAVIAKITYLRIGINKHGGGLTGVVYAQDYKGLIGSKSVYPEEISGCEVGDEIRGKRSGVVLTLAPAPCPIKVR